MTTATVEQVRAVAEYAEYAAREAVKGDPVMNYYPLSFKTWIMINYGCEFEQLGTP